MELQALMPVPATAARPTLPGKPTPAPARSGGPPFSKTLAKARAAQQPPTQAKADTRHTPPPPKNRDDATEAKHPGPKPAQAKTDESQAKAQAKTHRPYPPHVTRRRLTGHNHAELDAASAAPLDKNAAAATSDRPTPVTTATAAKPTTTPAKPTTRAAAANPAQTDKIPTKKTGDDQTADNAAARGTAGDTHRAPKAKDKTKENNNAGEDKKPSSAPPGVAALVAQSAATATPREKRVESRQPEATASAGHGSSRSAPALAAAVDRRAADRAGGTKQSAAGGSHEASGRDRRLAALLNHNTAGRAGQAADSIKAAGDRSFVLAHAHGGPDGNQGTAAPSIADTAPIPGVAPSPVHGLPPAGNTQAASAAVTPPSPVVNANLIAPLGTPDWNQALGAQSLRLLHNGDGKAELTLYPRDLGTLQVSLTLDHQAAQLHFVSPHADVRTAVQAALPQLKGAFAAAGINLGDTSVSDQSRQPAHDFQREGRRRSPRALASLSEATPPAPGLTITALAGRTAAGRIDLFA